MARSADICEVRARSGRFDNWTAVQVSTSYGSFAREFTLQAAEPGKVGQGWRELRLVPGDEVEIFLAGRKVIQGYVVARTTDYGPDNHVVIVQGLSKVVDIVESSTKPAQFRNYNFEQIARGVLKPFPVQLKLDNPPPGIKRPFLNVATFWGETVFEFLERLARMRGVFLRDDADGNVVAFQGPTSAGSGAELQEGRNILRCRATLRNDAIFSEVHVAGQHPGSDQHWGKRVAEVQATATYPAARPWRVMRVLAEEPVLQRDAQDRADREIAAGVETSIDVAITVRGWLRPDGKLWEPTERVTVKSPMAFPDRSGSRELAIRNVVFSQDNQQGTITTLTCCLPNALSTSGDPRVRGPVENPLENPKGDPARPSPDDPQGTN